jgi:hypothetical protein
MTSFGNQMYQCCRSVTFWYGSGAADPYHLLMDSDPDPALFVFCFQKSKFFAYYFLKVQYIILQR